MTTPDAKTSADALGRFAGEIWPRAASFLKGRFGLSDEDSRDIFQDAFIVLHDNIRRGKFVYQADTSLSAYFLSICRNLALAKLRKDGDTVSLDESEEITGNPLSRERLDELAACEEGSTEAEEETLEDIVGSLPSPCAEILWGYYRDNLSLSTLARMLNYKSENSVKVTKHRCMEKLRARYHKMTAK